MYLEKKTDIKVFKFEKFRDLDFVEACFTTRIGGKSSGAYEALNMGNNTNDELEHIEKNHEIALKALSLGEKKMIMTNQIHSDFIETIDGSYSDPVTIIQGKDGLVTDSDEFVLMTFYADCVPLFFVDPVKKVVATSHGGWKGTVKKIGAKTVERMVEVYGCSMSDILVGIGPSAGKCCYEVDDYVVDFFKTAFDSVEDIVKPSGVGKYHLDLREAHRKSLIEAGVPDENIEKSEECTICDDVHFFSYRRDHKVTGRMAAIIALKK